MLEKNYLVDVYLAIYILWYRNGMKRRGKILQRNIKKKQNDKEFRRKKRHKKLIKMYEYFIVSKTNTGLLEWLAKNDDGVLSSEMNKIVKFITTILKRNAFI